MKSFVIGMYVHDTVPEDGTCFVTERHCLSYLMDGLASPCPCGMTNNPWVLSLLFRYGSIGVVFFHVLLWLQ